MELQKDGSKDLKLLAGKTRRTPARPRKRLDNGGGGKSERGDRGVESGSSEGSEKPISYFVGRRPTTRGLAEQERKGARRQSPQKQLREGRRKKRGTRPGDQLSNNRVKLHKKTIHLRTNRKINGGQIEKQAQKARGGWPPKETRGAKVGGLVLLVTHGGTARPIKF